jgi:hypothetical protein
MFDVVADLIATKSLIFASAVGVARDAKQVCRFVHPEALTGSIGEGGCQSQVLPYSRRFYSQTPAVNTVTSHRFSLLFMPTLPTSSNRRVSKTSLGLGLKRDEEKGEL